MRPEGMQVFDRLAERCLPDLAEFKNAGGMIADKNFSVNLDAYADLLERFVAKVKLEDVAKRMLPILGLMIMVLLAVTYIPQLSLMFIGE